MARPKPLLTPVTRMVCCFMFAPVNGDGMMRGAAALAQADFSAMLA